MFLDQALDTLKTVQITPATERVELNDKMTKVMFNLNDPAYAKMLGGKGRSIIEKHKYKKHGEITTPYFIQNSDGYNNFAPLREFDRAVLSVCVSEWLAGNTYTTPRIILRGLTGKVFKDGVKVRPNQAAAITQSIDKLMFTAFDAKIAESFEKLGYGTNNARAKVTKSAILPCSRVQAIIGGQQIDAIFFDRECPLLQIADMKDQILRYDVTLLDVPNQNNTPMNIELKNYVMRRVLEIINHKMTPTITFDDIFAKCRITDARAKTKFDARNFIVKFLEHLQTHEIIKDFELVKRIRTLHGVKLDF